VSVARVALHGFESLELDRIKEIQVVSRTRGRTELQNALTAVQPNVLVIDLDHDGALDTVVTALEADSQLGVVGVSGETDGKFMIAALRAGCRQLSPKPIDANDLLVAIRRLVNETGHHRDQGRVFATIGAIGGAGSTTLSCYLAKGLAELTRQRTLLLDYDFDFGNIARAWDLSPSHTVADIASAGVVDAVMIDKAAISFDDQISVVARPETVNEGHHIDEHSAAGIIRTAKSSFPFVVIDLPRKLDAITGSAIELCDTLLIVLQLTVPAIDNARRLVDALSHFGFPSERWELVVNRFRKNVHTVSPEMVEKQFRKKILSLVPNDYAAISSAVDLGKPVAHKSPARAAISDLSASLIGRKPEPQTGGWRSIFGFRRGQEKQAVPTT